jgi:hypothetical protein
MKAIEPEPAESRKAITMRKQGYRDPQNMYMRD